MSFAEYIPRTDDSLSDLPPQLEFSLQPLPDTPRPSAELQIRTSPVKISFGQPSVRTVKKGWKSISPKQKARVSLFDEDEEDVQGAKGEKEARKEIVPEKEQGTMGEALPHPDTLIHRLTLASTRYTTLLTSLPAPLRAAFDSFSTLPSSPPPPPIDLFLDEYLGRKARDDEVKRVEEVWEAKKEWEREEEMGRRYLEEVGKGGRVEGVNAVPAERGVVRASPVAIAAPKPEPEPEPEPQAPASGAESQPQSQVAIPLPAARTSVYQKLAPVGEGTYGKVYKALSLITHQPVALKRIRMENEKDGFPVTAMREIKLLQMLQHENVLRLMEMVVERGGVYMVLEYMEFDLTGLLAHPEIKFSSANIKSLSHQMLSGLSYLHHQSILHRDMKGSNILVNSRGELKLADFGLARVYAKKRREDYTNRVITLWYRSPELLMGETIYGPEVDMWSAGCIILELYTTKPIFQGSDELNQLEVIYALLGTPTEAEWPSVKELPWYELVKPKEEIGSKFRTSFAKWLSPAALDLVEGLLFYDPSQRLLADSALRTDYFLIEEPAMEKPTQYVQLYPCHPQSLQS
ncbi:CMGC/CDK/CRK7 protein kinase [Cryptococcus gattii Ru294]|uniref:[RNA-polymerase]-subunit kinase n=2 Tax=Cryptococcus gattii TaxID=37769 RepID=E6RBG5_CRYGW|nr:Protein kinase, putative [Cryptococcus gattii WM276]KIR51386.1 CMGC/CDK/CRK7 protein kinase [Cryptococcus gattii Ru294]KIR81199.1 CMGC/CDK/CRK7 protein kinase [Cryptococcus gattii EJB2]KIY34807.1 CMGC/CDK/CRK7 protein kinase [Cryptococcus gattii E566]KJE01376.1 CMGC/CDK/CRK7 protein kinase [Cryptococcus gattii NT-10]ADV24133.1 Protein kinase, putative [Cryptococcus gattii WM276]